MGIALLVGLLIREYERMEEDCDAPQKYEGESEEEDMMETSWGMA